MPYVMPATGREPAEILAEVSELADAENERWQDGSCSGTMYCGDLDHYAFMADVFAKFGHANALQRDMCPSATTFEGGIIDMTLDMLGANDMPEGSDPVGMVTSGGSGSILHAVLAYREAATARGITSPNLLRPETAHPAFDKACHLLGVELRHVDVDPVTTKVDPEAMRARIDANTIALVGSACNYPYGTIDPIGALGQLALEHETGLHVDACLGGFILPWGRELGYPIEAFDLSVPGVTTISADTHKYGYAYKGTSVLVFADRALRNGQYFFRTGWTGGKYSSPGIEGSRSVGLLAATWASMVKLGRQGYLDYARQIFETADRMKALVEAHDELRIIGDPTFCFSFTSDEFDIYHVNDHLLERGWRLNGQQYPNAVHMAVTRPQTLPGVVERFGTDLADAVAHARAKGDEPAFSGAIYGGAAGGFDDEAQGFIESVLEGMMDEMQAVPVADSTP